MKGINNKTEIIRYLFLKKYFNILKKNKETNETYRYDFLLFITIIVMISRKFKISIIYFYKKFLELFFKYGNMDYFLF